MMLKKIKTKKSFENIINKEALAHTSWRARGVLHLRTSRSGNQCKSEVWLSKTLRNLF